MYFLKRYKACICYVLLAMLMSHLTLNMGAAKYVLCFGADGHIAVEHAQQDKAVRFNKRDFSPYQTIAKSVDCDLPCIDIPLDGEEDQNTFIPSIDFSKVSIAFWSSSLFLFLLLACCQVVTDCRLYFYYLGFIDSRLLAIRSTILLI